MDHELVDRLLTLRVPSERAIRTRLAAGRCYRIPALRGMTMLVYLQHVTVTGPNTSEVWSEGEVDRARMITALSDGDAHWCIDGDDVHYVGISGHDDSADNNDTLLSLPDRSRQFMAAVLRTRARMRRELGQSE